jgi:hypothetical protein
MNPSGIPEHNCPGNPPPSSTCFNQERHFLGRKLTFRIESLLFEHKVHFQSMKPTFLTSIPWYLPLFHDMMADPSFPDKCMMSVALS